MGFYQTNRTFQTACIPFSFFKEAMLWYTGTLTTLGQMLEQDSNIVLDLVW